MSTTIVVGAYFLTFAAVFWLLYVKLTGKAFVPAGMKVPNLDNNKKYWFAGLLAVVAVISLIWWFWSTVSESLWWRVVSLALIAFICFRWAKSKDKGLISNIGNAALIALAVVLLVSAPGRGVGDSFDAKAEAVTEHGISALVPNSFNCPDENQDANVGGVYEVVRECGTLRLTGLLPKGVKYQVIEGQGDLDYEDNLSPIDRPYKNIRIFKVLDEVPESTVVRFRIVSAEEWERIISEEKQEEVNPLFLP